MKNTTISKAEFVKRLRNPFLAKTDKVMEAITQRIQEEFLELNVEPIVGLKDTKRILSILSRNDLLAVDATDLIKLISIELFSYPYEFNVTIMGREVFQIEFEDKCRVEKQF